MIAGATYTLPIDIQYQLENVARVIVTLKNETTQQKILKNYPNDNETYLMSDGRLGVRLSQQDTIDLVGSVKVEAQINIGSGAVAKTETKRVFVSPTLHTEIVDGAADNGEVMLDGVRLELGAPITEVEADGGGESGGGESGGGESGGSNGVKVDKTLTISGAAADAKVVGDRFAAQQKQIDKKQPAGDYALKNEIPVQSVNGKTGAVQLAAEDVGAEAAGTADRRVGEHNVSENAHNDIRMLISGLSERLNALANSTDEDLDQLAEIVAYIKANKTLIDSITTSKVSVADIIDNLTTNVSDKPLSAKMGVELKRLIDAIQIPTELPASDVYEWAKQPQKPTYTADEVGADAAGTADSRVGEHNVSENAHNDIRMLISGLSERLNALANSTDEDLDQLAEIVAYIKANKTLIDSITTSKVSVADIIDNLTTNVSDKPLSAKMGVELKRLIDAIQIPTELPASDVYEWAKQPQKPTYTADEVGAASRETVEKLTETVDTKADTSHTQSASTITAGTFAGQVVANSGGQSPTVSCLRNSKFSFDESDVPTVEGETVWYLK